MHVRPGARELLAEVADAGIAHALVTSSQREFAEAVLASTGLRFPVVVTGDDVTAHKPDPQPYLLAARLLGVDPGRCVALEDSPNGVASATAAGCLVIAVPSLLPIPPAPGRVIAQSLSEVNLKGLVTTSIWCGHARLWEAASMNGYSSVFWLALCASLTALGLVLTVLVGRRRSTRSMLHGAAWSLIPIAAYMTGSTLMLWRIGEAIGAFASVLRVQHAALGGDRRGRPHSRAVPGQRRARRAAGPRGRVGPRGSRASRTSRPPRRQPQAVARGPSRRAVGAP